MGSEKQPSSNTNREQEIQGSARRFKDGLVVELWTKNGPFWESVRDMRDRWGIEARAQLEPRGNPRVGDLVLPESAPTEYSQKFFDFVDRWMQDLESIKDKTVPAWFEDAADWKAFISACVLCDPPEESLIEFAKHGDSRMIHAPYTGEPSNKAAKLPLIAAAPIRRLPGEADLKEVQLWLFDRIIDAIRCDPTLLRFDIHDLIDHVFRTNFDLRFEYFKKVRELPRQWYIEVTEGITKAQVGNTFDKIVGAHEPRSEEGRPPRNPLVALQCAILYDRHNPQVTKGRRKYTYARLAEVLGLPSAYSAKMHTKDGREILKKL